MRTKKKKLADNYAGQQRAKIEIFKKLQDRLIVIDKNKKNAGVLSLRQNSDDSLRVIEKNVFAILDHPQGQDKDYPELMKLWGQRTAYLTTFSDIDNAKAKIEYLDKKIVQVRADIREAELRKKQTTTAMR